MKVLLTGFGPFPGVPVNATMRLVPELAARAKQVFPGATIIAEILPTEWLAAPLCLKELLDEIKPDLALHFGVSSRARGFEVEQRGRNICTMQPDASGALPPLARIRSDGPELMRARLPVTHIVSRLRRRGIAAFASRDAGAYLCNALLYHSCDWARSAPARRVGFVHIPASLAKPGGANRGRSGACPLTWTQAVDGALEILAACLDRAPIRPALHTARAGTHRRVRATHREAARA